MYYVRYPVGHPIRNCVLKIYAKKETTQLHKALDIFCYFSRLQKLTKINY